MKRHFGLGKVEIGVKNCLGDISSRTDSAGEQLNQTTVAETLLRTGIAGGTLFPLLSNFIKL